MKIEEVSYS